jgi:hypothetical protein
MGKRATWAVVIVLICAAFILGTSIRTHQTSVVNQPPAPTAPLVAQANTNVPSTSKSSVSEVPQFPASPLNALKASLAATTSPADELWRLGPANDFQTEIVVGHFRQPPTVIPGGTSESGGPLTMSGELQSVTRQYTVVERTLIARLTIRPTSPDLTIDAAFAIWKGRLTGIIENDEIDVAAKALRDARAQSLQTNDNSTPIEAYGKRFETRVRDLSRRSVIIELLWMDPNELEAKAAWAKYSASIH